jgi:hypothetical protein
MPKLSVDEFDLIKVTEAFDPWAYVSSFLLFKHKFPNRNLHKILGDRLQKIFFYSIILFCLKFLINHPLESL